MGLLQDFFRGGPPDSKRQRTVEIEGFGPMTIRSLSKREMLDCKQLADGDQDLQMVHIIQRGMEQPKCDDEFLAEVTDTPNVLDAIGVAIIGASWPNDGMEDHPREAPRKHKPAPYDAVEREKYVRVSIAGESHYQDALREICGRKKDEEVGIEYVATLVPEPENPYDPNAVRVEIDGKLVGYLSRDDAPGYHRRIARFLEEGGDPTVEAFIGAQGPAAENPNIGVQLHIPKDSPFQTPLR